MQKYKDQKEMRMAVNGRMITMVAGIFVISTAIFTTIRYGVGLFQAANEAAKGNEELVAVMEDVGIGVGYLRFTSIYLLLIALFEGIVGALSVRMCNRLDKAKELRKLCLGLIAAEVILQPIVLRTQTTMISNLMMPLCLLWGIHQLCKLAKLYPDRIFAVEQNNRRNGRGAKASPKPKKSLMERTKVPSENNESTEE